MKITAITDSMELITKEDFRELVQHQSDICISVFIPTHRAGVEVNEKQDAIAYKNALQEVTRQLQQREITQREIDNLLQPAFEYYKDEVFWNSQQDGLVLFLSPNLLKIFKLPYTVAEEVFINSSFFITPLLPAITNNQEFYLLSLSKHDAKFYRGDAYGLTYLEVEGLPNGIEDVIHFEEKGIKQLFRQGGKGGTGSANFHGHGEGQGDDKDNIGIYCQEVDRTLLAEVLHDKTSPLILAGVEYLLPIYRSASHYKHIYEDVITGNQQNESEQSLFLKAREKLTPYFEQKTKNALQNYYNGIATSVTSSMPEKVIPGSYYAQVSDLFVCIDTHIWGTFNEIENKLEIHETKQDGDTCLIDKAVVHTYLNGGNVYLLNKDQMPKGSIIAATLRF
jgi:hypothetical protein